MYGHDTFKGKLITDNVEESVICESSMNPKEIFMNKILECIDEIASEMDALKVENVELRDKFTKQEEEKENLKVQYEYV